MDHPSRLDLFYSPAYVLSEYSFDTTRKSRWVAESLAERPIPGVRLVAPEPLDEAAVAAVHDPAYVTAVRTGEPRALAESGGFSWDPGLWSMVLASNGGAVSAALAALAGGRIAGSLSSGLHHAKRAHGDGYCTFNGLALAAGAAKRAGAERILVLDLDAHCGGGTFELLSGDPAVRQVDLAVSPYDRYGPSERMSLDVIVQAGEYLPTLRARLDALAKEGSPFDLVLYNAGMDPYEGCATGGLEGITREILAERERTVFDWCRAEGLPVAFVLAGGYTGARVTQAELVDLHRLTISAAAG